MPLLDTFFCLVPVHVGDLEGGIRPVAEGDGQPLHHAVRGGRLLPRFQERDVGAGQPALAGKGGLGQARFLAGIAQERGEAGEGRHGRLSGVRIPRPLNPGSGDSY